MFEGYIIHYMKRILGSFSPESRSTSVSFRTYCLSPRVISLDRVLQ